MKIIKTALTRAPRICIYGQHGIGKSTFGSQCPKPIFIQTEDGLGALGVDAFELATTYDMVLEQIRYLGSTEHSFQTLVIDSVDWMEKLIFAKVCVLHNISDIAALSFGRGYSLATRMWADFIEELENLLLKKRMMLVLLAHATIKRFEDPERESYDRYQLDIRDRDANSIAEYVDILGFASYKVMTDIKDKGFKQEIVKAKTTGERIVSLAEKPSHTAKNRFNLPDVLPLNWKAFETEFKGKFKKPAKVKEEPKEAKPNLMNDLKKEYQEKKAAEAPKQKTAAEVFGADDINNA